MKRKSVDILLWVILGIFALYKVGLCFFPRELLPGSIILSVFPFAFALIHGSLNYRFRDILVFLALTLVVSNALENCSILTGFPFGDYYYTDFLGWKLFLVPASIGLAYFGMGYLSWMLARIIMEKVQTSVSGHFTYTIPLLAAVLMVSWDLTFDPISSTILKCWTWEQGGSYFGVPFSNFIGWFFTVYIFFQLFAIYLRFGPKVYASAKPEISKSYWLQAAAFYGIVGLAAVLSALIVQTADTVTDPAGATWRMKDIVVTCGLVSIFTMVAFTFLSIVKIAGLPTDSGTTAKNN